MLLAETQVDDGVKRSYRARHGRRAQTWGFDIGQDGKLRAFGPN